MEKPDLLNPPNLEQILPGLKLLSNSKPVKTEQQVNQGHFKTPEISQNYSNDSECRKKLKNRESAQAARDRRRNRVVCLERQVADLSGRNKFLETENRDLKQRLQHYEADHVWRLMQHKSESNKVLEQQGSNQVQNGQSYQNFQQNQHYQQQQQQQANQVLQNLQHQHRLNQIQNQQQQQQQNQQNAVNLQAVYNQQQKQQEIQENMKRKSSSASNLCESKILIEIFVLKIFELRILLLFLAKVSDIQAYLSDEPSKKVRRTSRLRNFFKKC